MSDVFEVLAEPHRRQILALLLRSERPVGQLVEAMRLSQPSVSKHLRVLRDAGLVSMRQDAQQRVYRLKLEALLELDSWLTPFREQWSNRLDALEAHLDAMDVDDQMAISGPEQPTTTRNESER